MQNEELLCTSKNNKRVIFDPLSSHTATHFKDTPKLRELVEELLSNMVIDGHLIAKDFDLGQIIGDSDVVEVNDTDELIFAMRKNREDQGFVPFTKSRPPQPSRLLSIYLAYKDSGTYELLSSWIGEFESPPFPLMNNATAHSIPYWTKHAFVWGSQEIIPGTENYKRPW